MKKCSCKGYFLEKFIQPFILMQLYQEKLHGFALYLKLLKSDIMDYSGLDPGGLYRTLKKMEEAGLLLSEWQLDESSAQPRRVYTITAEGKQCLEFWQETLMEYKGDVERLAQAVAHCLNR